MADDNALRSNLLDTGTAPTPRHSRPRSDMYSSRSNRSRMILEDMLTHQTHTRTRSIS